MSSADVPTPGPASSRLQRWLYAGLGVLCVGLGALGVVLPGLPTTVFLLAASWLFTRSCPWLEKRLLGLPLFRPFRPYLRPGARMPRRAAAAALVLMWTAILASAGLLLSGEPGRPFAAAIVILAGLVGTVFILRSTRLLGDQT